MAATLHMAGSIPGFRVNPNADQRGGVGASITIAPSAIFGDRVSPSLKKGFLADKFVGDHGSRRSDTRKRSGEAFSVLTDVPKEILTLQVPKFEKPLADPKSVCSVILGGGAGTRLFPLTRRRANRGDRINHNR